MDSQTPDKKTLIAALASHDDPGVNNSLARLFETLHDSSANLLRDFHFVITGGTFKRILARDANTPGVEPVSDREGARSLLRANTTCLPPREKGGVTLLSYLIVERQCEAIWPFFTPLTGHWLTPENLALMRLCDLWHVKRLMNTGSVEEWFKEEARTDVNRNRQPWPPAFYLADDTEPTCEAERLPGGGWEIKPAPPEMPRTDAGDPDFRKMTIALIAHDEMKSRMVEFAIDYERELSIFHRILTTGTTGRQVKDATPKLGKGRQIHLYHSGPKGGDIEIATEVLLGGCHVVVFFVDPLHPHPHIEDIRVVFGACMIRDQVRMLTNEMQAREWMGRVVRKRL